MLNYGPGFGPWEAPMISRKAIFFNLMVASILAFAPNYRAASAQSGPLQLITDDSTGIRIGLPAQLLNTAKTAKRGTNWSSGDKSISIDTLAFGNDTSLRELYERLRQIRGRTLTRSDWLNAGFIIAGRDADGSEFYLEMRQASAGLRGFSFVYSPARKAEAAALLSSIIESFEPFPSAKAVETSEGAMDRRAAPARTCDAERAVLQALAAGIRISIEPNSFVKAGDAIAVTWRRGNTKAPLDLPAHIVYSMPDEVRFEGQHILPIPAQGRVPSDIEFGAGRMRVFTPLAAQATPDSGSFKIKPYKAGPFTIDYALVSKTQCGESVLAAGRSGAIEVEPGAPKILIQDFFPAGRPDQTLVSNDGRYRLEISAENYRVFEISSGIKIVDRAGRHPNFSPAARFVAAYTGGNEFTGGTMELIDLVTAEPVPNFRLSGPTLDWALNDAILVDGTMGHPRLRLHRTLIDPTFAKESPDSTEETEVGAIELLTSGRGSGAWERYRPKLFLDRNLIVIEDYSYPGQEAFRTYIFELASGYSLGEIAASGNNARENRQAAGEVQGLLIPYGVKDYVPAFGWDMGQRAMLSHFSPSIDENLSEIEKQFVKEHKTPAKRRLPRQKEFLIEHSKIPDSEGTPVQPRLSQSKAALDWRTRTAGLDRDAMAAHDPANFAQQLAQYAICVEPGCSPASSARVPQSFVKRSDFLQWSFQYGSQSTEFTMKPADLESALATDIAVAKELLTAKPNNICYQELKEGEEKETKTKFRIVPDAKGHTDVHGIWNWTAGDKRYWLIQAVCSHAGILNSPVFLFEAAPGTPGQVYALGGSAQYGDGLNKNFEGAQSEAVLRVRPEILDGRWLLITAPASSAAGIIDLRQPDKPVYVYELVDAYATVHLFRSQDGSRLVQLNSDGRFHIYRTDTGDRSISGRWIDNEILLVTANGYYHGSYEGANFVHLTFTGEREIYSLAQFSKVLNRPDVVARVLAGQIEDGERPVLAVPPHVTLSLDATGTPKLDLSARSGLKAVRFFDDGQPILQLGLSGTRAVMTVPLAQLPTGKWVTAIAEDRAGFLSAPSAVAVEASSQNRRRLHAVVAGIDTYNDTRLKLDYARSDAMRLAAALRAAEGQYYAFMDITQLLDREATTAAIVSALRSAISRAQPGDTVLFSFAGHGFNANGSYYLTPAGFDTADPQGTGLPWAQLAKEFGQAKVRVIIVLDACHSGSTGSEGLATNDEVAAELLKGNRAPVLVLAASKGRQTSRENAKWGGGIFTYALTRVLTADRAASDTNGNGALEISELYGAVKSLVVRETGGRQTPWLARQDLAGDFALF